MMAIIRTPAASAPVSRSMVMTPRTTSDHARARATRRSWTRVIPNPTTSVTTSPATHTRAAPPELGRDALTDEPRVNESDDEIPDGEIREERDEQPVAQDEHQTSRR